MQVSTTQQLTVKRFFEHASGRAVTVPAKWYSSDLTIAGVDNTGLVTGTAKTGPVSITAVSGPFHATVSVVVVPSGTFTALAIASPDTKIAKGLTEQYTATATIGGASVDVTTIASWSSTITSVAPINAAGAAFGLAKGGPATIQASLTIASTTVPSNTLALTIGDALLQQLVVSPSTVFMPASVLAPPQSSTVQLSATGIWTDGARDATAQANWSTSSSAAATVNASGLVTAVDTDPANNNDLATISASLTDIPNSVTKNASATLNMMTYNEAGRFLEQATFGPTPADVAHLQSIGFDAWFNEQFGISQGFSSYTAAPDIPTVQNRFYLNALTAPDQLRMRTAFALEQIWVISSNTVTDPNGFVPWQNIMERDAFGNYRDLMYDATLSPAMGVYLNMVNNDAPQPGQNPNENYARELLQLFTIGLFQLQNDGSQVVDAGNPVPTYDESVVQGFAHVFTGWTFPTAPGQLQRTHNPSYYGLPPYGSPMENVTLNHDSNQQTLLNGLTVSGTGPAELNQALDDIFAQSTLAPFVCKQMIKHMVKSNPTPGYVTRVVNAFNGSGGSTVPGDLKVTVKAILLDPEARAGDFPSGTVPNTDGHLREPALFMVGVLRALNSTDTGSSLAGRGSGMGENILTSPTVFNFFPPDYVIPQNYFNPIQVGVLGPEFGIETPQIAVNRANYVSSVVYGTLEPSVLPTLNSYTTLSGSNPAGLVDALNLRLMHGKMSSAMRTQIITAVSAYPASPALTRVQAAVYLIVSSSQYQVTY
jgi:uncharacterized protein (DUF1800 family)